jgi:RNA-directed DNA polymerase
MRVFGKSAEVVVAMRPGESREEQRTEETKEQSSRESWKMEQERHAETAGSDNCGHQPGLANHGQSDEVAVGPGSGKGKEPTSAPTPQKAMYEALMEEIVSPFNSWRALRAVEQNGGAPGIDGMTTKQLREHLRRHEKTLIAKLLAGTYTPSPVRRVEILKADGKSKRMLGIPTVLDRWVQQMLLRRLQRIFDPGFSEHSYAFRNGRSQQQAVRAAQKHVQAGKSWVADMDVTKFFDRVNHDILMTRIGQTIRDKRVLRLIGRYLRAGVMMEGVVHAVEEGTPQGGPLSPLLANVYLDALDKELERRGLAFSRYADDCNIYVSSQRAAQRVLESITQWLEKHLRLEVNRAKSGVGPAWERKFLGFRITPKGEIEIAPQNLERFRNKVRELWRSCQSLSSNELRDQWRAYVTGWWQYFRLGRERRSIFALEGWIRRHIRKCFWLRWHDWEGRRNALRRLGLKGRQLLVAHSSKGAWPIARSPSLQTALSNKVLRRHGFVMPSDLAATM